MDILVNIIKHKTTIDDVSFFKFIKLIIYYNHLNGKKEIDSIWFSNIKNSILCIEVK